MNPQSDLRNGVPHGPRHLGNRQLHDKRGRPNAGTRLGTDRINSNSGIILRCPWPKLALPLTRVVQAPKLLGKKCERFFYEEDKFEGRTDQELHAR